jgi:predicted nucleotidyltransferase
MNVLGFDEALHAAIQVKINRPPSPQAAQFTINVASPAGIGVLKLIAWLERDQHIRQKDAADLLYLISTYHKIPAVFTALYDDGYMAANQWDDLRASAQKLGVDMATLASPQTKAYLIDNLITDPAKLTTLARQMKLSGHESIDDCMAYLQCLLRGFSETL